MLAPFDKFNCQNKGSTRRSPNLLLFRLIPKVAIPGPPKGSYQYCELQKMRSATPHGLLHFKHLHR